MTSRLIPVLSEIDTGLRKKEEKENTTVFVTLGKMEESVVTVWKSSDPTRSVPFVTLKSTGSWLMNIPTEIFPHRRGSRTSDLS